MLHIVVDINPVAGSQPNDDAIFLLWLDIALTKWAVFGFTHTHPKYKARHMAEPMKMVLVAGIEPTAPCLQGRRSTY